MTDLPNVLWYSKLEPTIGHDFGPGINLMDLAIVLFQVLPVEKNNTTRIKY